MLTYSDFLRRIYRGGRPNPIAKLANRVARRMADRRPGRLATLEVPGRRSGRTIAFPVVVTDYDGGRYLVAMLGERTNWVRNVGASAGAAVLRGDPVRLEPVTAAERAPILRRYVEIAPSGRVHIPVPPGAPLVAFDRVAPGYPVFRVLQRA
ncbi:nitroreductase family deazaflavin-dependent oxidoreductase [Cryptosporangium sp. NPDC051539]|uniref:nitroreductase family deazaflavin-dependent oxidoreductase n=1 Tax=Cryptosporangium sp. NPDC051539 TaxID=3363962 RepID=UPI0037B807C7